MADFGILAVYETHLPVFDLARSVAFYRDVIGLTLAREMTARNVALFWVGDKTTGMLGLWGTGSGPLRMVQHFAFRMGLDDVIAAVDRLRALDVTPLGFNGEQVDEPVVIGWMPSVSIYFKDPDGNSIEFIAALDMPADADFGIGRIRNGRRGGGKFGVAVWSILRHCNKIDVCSPPHLLFPTIRPKPGTGFQTSCAVWALIC